MSGAGRVKFDGAGYFAALDVDRSYFKNSFYPLRREMSYEGENFSSASTIPGNAAPSQIVRRRIRLWHGDWAAEFPYSLESELL